MSDILVETPLADAHVQLADAIKILGYDQGMCIYSRCRGASSPSAFRCGATTARSRS